MVSGRRVVALVAALALILGGFALTTGKAEAAPSAAVAVDDGGSLAAVGTAQIDTGALIRSIVCPILDRLASGPFGPFIGNIVASLRARFGCPS
jgi:hypothetical protein